MPDAKAALKALTAEYADLNRRYLALADKRRCEIASRNVASIIDLCSGSEGLQFAASVAVRQADALIAELEKRRDEFDESLADA